MEKLDLSKYKIQKSKITNERQLILKEFLDRLNADRKDYPPIKPARLGMMMRFMTVGQMKQFYAELNYCKNFSKSFWFRFKK